MGYPTSDIGYSEHSNVPRPTASQLTKKALPDVVLLNIFKYIHPIDLVNGISRVSKRWNALAKTPSLYRYVRVLVNKKSTDSGSAKKFLERAKNCVRKLCVTCEMNVFGDIFPKCMPNVTFLDMTSFPGFVNKICGNAVEFYRLQDTVELVSQLGLGKILQTPIRDTLTEFYLRGYLQDGDYAVIGQLINLSKLSVFSSLYATDEQLMQLKSLRNLEHLHLDCSGQDCDFTIEGLIRFFELPTENESNHFPYRLKYLCFIECYNFQTDVAKALVKRPVILTSEVWLGVRAGGLRQIGNCPQLVSLNVSENCFLPDEGLTLLIKGLP
ncbi:unnamed protein product [Anisakis simplex]|uniref:F-box domain-containing protein n=1 Tax=Anisakis simplex TaxID=6269 RepID=A0A0M3IYT7_ANISI|nr:unnamed protein product [Anisakis simplex]